MLATENGVRSHDFGGTVALVSGGGSGIGRAVAVRFSQLGADVVVAGRRAEALNQTVALNPRITISVGDVSRVADCERIVNDVVSRFGRLDILVNNAGALRRTPLGETDPAIAQMLWATNVLGPTMLSQAALPHLEQVHGQIINVSSAFGQKPAPSLSQYGATKAALEHLTRSWAVELAGRGIRVNALAPGPTESDALQGAGFDPDTIEAIKAHEQKVIPLGRRGEAADIVHWVVALASPAAGWTTGQVIGVDGGFALT